MVRFDWKHCDKEQFPPEPEVTKDFWKQEHPGWDKWEVRDWYSTVFETYACKLKGEDGPVPSQLYYIGNREWMTESGWVLEDGHVEAWDSYTSDIPDDVDYPLFNGTVIADESGIYTDAAYNNPGKLFVAASFVNDLVSEGNNLDTVLGVIRAAQGEFDMGDDLCTE